MQNLVHGSDSPESAAREIALWFPPRGRDGPSVVNTLVTPVTPTPRVAPGFHATQPYDPFGPVSCPAAVVRREGSTVSLTSLAALAGRSARW